MPASRSAKAQPGRSLAEVLFRGDPAGFLGFRPEPFAQDEVLSAWRAALRRRGDPGVPRTVQLYAHFALCRMSCRFCQYFHALTRDDAELDRYTDHLAALAESHERALGRVKIDNAYFGGGTPTALTTPMLRRLQRAFRAAFDVTGEFTSEAHPTTLDGEKLAALRGLGVNRVSMGLQSLDAEVLRRVGRENGETAAIRGLVAEAQRLGMLVNVDLIAGLPSQSIASFGRDLEETAALGPDTITLYRYQPVHRLPEVPSPAMALGAALPARRLAGMAARGYVPFSPVADERYSVLLVRAGSPRVLRFLHRNTVGSALAWAAGRWAVPRYTDVDRTDVLMMGLGPGAVSHVHGLGWFRDVTALRAADGKSGAVYWGTRLSEEEERRGGLVIDLARGDWVSARRLELGLGLGLGRSAVAGRVGIASRVGALQRVFGLVRIHPSATAAERAEILDALWPEGASASAASADADAKVLFARTLAFQMRKDVQPELVELDRSVREAGAA